MLSIVLLTMGLTFVIVVFKLLISRKLSGRISLPWIACSLLVIILSLFPHSIDWLADIVGISYPPALLFLASTLFMLIFLLYQSILISALQDKLRELTQTVSIMKSIGPDSPQVPQPNQEISLPPKVGSTN